MVRPIAMRGACHECGEIGELIRYKGVFVCGRCLCEDQPSSLEDAMEYASAELNEDRGWGD